MLFGALNVMHYGSRRINIIMCLLGYMFCCIYRFFSALFYFMQDFGSIFSTLLPGTQAKLVAPDGQSILDGLEVKVAFGDVWKESLTELSGGQRQVC